MAPVLPISRGNSVCRPVSTPADCVPDHFTAFQQILELACSRIDALRSTHPDLQRRMVPRTKAALPAECSGTWGSSRCLITDYGEGGLAIVCGHPHALGDVLRVRWLFGKDQLPAEVDCIVRHVTGTHIGIQFLNVSARQRTRLTASLQYVSEGISETAA